MRGLVDLSQETKRCKCPDPRARIHAFLSLAAGVGCKMDIKPDYTKSICEAYQEFCLKYIENVQLVNILGYCELQGRLTEMPSWVPD